MKRLFVIVVAVVALCGGALAFLTLKETVQRHQAMESLVVPESGDVGSPAVARRHAEDDEDAGASATAEPHWKVGFGDDRANAWDEIMTAQQNGKDAHVFARTGSDMQIMVVISSPEIDGPATEIIATSHGEAEQQGVSPTPIEIVSYGSHAWTGFQFHFQALQKTSMLYASIDTTERGAKLVIVGSWPDTENDADSALFMKVLEHITVQRQE